MENERLDQYSNNNVFLTFVELFREDEEGPYSIKEIGYRVLESHPNFKSSHHNFNLIHIPNQYQADKIWAIVKRLLDKNKSSSEIQSIINYLYER